MKKLYTPCSIFEISYTSNYVRNYQEAIEYLKEINGIQSNIPVSSIGKSRGYPGNHEPLDIFAVDLFATEKSKRTIFIVGGFHRGEEGSSESVLSLLENIVNSSDNPNLRKIRKDTHIFLVPQINSDYYASFKDGNPNTFTSDLYNDDINSFPLTHVFDFMAQENSKRFPELPKELFDESDLYGKISPEAMCLVNAIDSRIQQYGRPVIAVNFHETPVNGTGSTVQNYKYNTQQFVYYEIKKYFKITAKNTRSNLIMPTFDTLLKSKVARFSVTTETDSKAALEERVKINLMIVERLMHEIL